MALRASRVFDAGCFWKSGGRAAALHNGLGVVEDSNAPRLSFLVGGAPTGYVFEIAMRLVALDEFEDVAVDYEGGDAQEEDQADLDEAFFDREA